MSRHAAARVAAVVVLVLSWWMATVVAGEERSAVTRIVLAVSDGPVAYTDRAQMDPPAIFIEFQSRNVRCELEPVMPVAFGIIKEIRSDFHRGSTPQRSLKTIALRLTQPASYVINQGSRQILIDIETPASLMSGKTEVGRGMTILGLEGRHATLQRLEAMSAALEQAVPNIGPVVQERAPVVVTKPLEITRPGAPPQAAPNSRNGGRGVWLGFLLGASGVGAIGTFWRKRRRGVPGETRLRTFDATVPSVTCRGNVFEQLALKAFQRQGQTVVRSRVIEGVGTLWVVQKDGERQGLLCLIDGPFFERKVLEQFYTTLQQETLPSGTVMALGTFTAPAQAFAEEHQMHLVVRDEAFQFLETALKDPVLEFTEETLTQPPDQPSPDLAQARIKMLEQECATHAEGQSTAMAQLQALETEAESLKQQLGESERALAEERAKRHQLEGQVRELEQALATKAQPQSEVGIGTGPTTVEEVEVAMQRADAEQQLLQESSAAETNSVHQDVVPAATPEADRSPASERRKWPRLELAALAEQGLVVRVSTQDADGPEILGMVKNVGRGGFMAEVDHELLLGAVTVELFPFNSLVLIEASGEVVWQKKDEEGSKVHVGVSIDSISKNDVNRLLQYMKQVEGMIAASVSGTA